MPIYEKPVRPKHTTQDEINYLLRIGEWNNGRLKHKRCELLLSYLKSMRGEREWGGIDPIKIRALVKDMIRTEFPWVTDPELSL